MFFLFPLFAVLIWSVNAIVNKLSASAIEPAAISFYRWLLALLVLTPFVLPGVIRQWQTIRPHLLRLMVLGLLGMALYQSLAYYAAHSVSALFMGIIAALIPLLTVLLSVVILRIAPTVGILAGSLISFCGLIWLVSAGNLDQLLHHGIGAGEAMMLAASASYALYGVMTKRWSIPLPVWQSLYVQIAFGVLLLLPGFLMTPDVALTPRNLPLVAFAGLFASILAPWLWIHGVQKLGASITSIFMNLTPVFTALIAVLFLHEHLHSYHWIGGGLTLTGVLLAQRLRRPLSARKSIKADPR
ncbi:drug/metabolite transporter (DMT)-like permease [Pantoea sp. PA1]|jgi:drug/metabolite transporter (DMT)-like permease|uniref:Transporter EamA family YyaM n=3 Tax=Pantoea ananas TaxID=553 RepID=A0A0H3L2G7_PANAA|nr:MULTISPECIES: DMT family transporter [Pantoea]AER31878.1 DMT superfamily transporter YyaM [Pantoea ananatis PA13]AVG77716.1 DMT family transporter [Pantoea ananatis]ERM12219.1 multidrug DMT transporter [Pantoea ananatis BRT175]MCH9267765.1 DMT family transporter [Pantoea ananatis]MCV3299160.1 DMT family transporter [Pantoea ananatis]